MSYVAVEMRVDLVIDGHLQELDEAAIAARRVYGDTAPVREARALDGAIRIGSAELVDELFSAVQRLCFEGAAALLTDGAIVEYQYFSSNENARLVANGETVVLSGSGLGIIMRHSFKYLEAEASARPQNCDTGDGDGQRVRVAPSGPLAGEDHPP